MPELRHCHNCYFWSAVRQNANDNPREAKCQLNPPEAEKSQPTTGLNDFCGSWLHKEDPPPSRRFTLGAVAMQSLPGTVLKTAFGALLGPIAMKVDPSELSSNFTSAKLIDDEFQHQEWKRDASSKVEIQVFVVVEEANPIQKSMSTT
ncbi:hypothetical protein [uncultured Roseovarius sp.]|uniref:hypothetical protein n=1 Tax=uncultured Roseovarius sp. TaxID=293344 RepID=UPI00260A0EC2|nr:hypothetical protein [uncultured Roseovarius sp.]